MDLVEQDLAALVDYLCGYAIKSSQIVPNSLLLVAGGKAFNEYIKKPFRRESYDWDCKIY